MTAPFDVSDATRALEYARDRARHMMADHTRRQITRSELATELARAWLEGARAKTNQPESGS